jgi:hypothetical protein
LRGFVFAGELCAATLAVGLGDAVDALAVCGGRSVPDCDWTSEMSELLMNPFTVTSSRKLLDVAAFPDSAWV